MLFYSRLRKNPPKSQVTYTQGQEIVQRVGFSVSWRYSARYGYRRIVAPWILWLPTLRIIVKWIESTLQRLLGFGKIALGEWLLRKTAGLGASSSILPDGMTGSVVLSLNSFFYDGFWRRQSWKSMSYGEKWRTKKKEAERRKLIEESGVVGE